MLGKVFCAVAFACAAAKAGDWDADLADFPRLAGETDDSPRFMRAVAAAANGGFDCAAMGDARDDDRAEYHLNSFSDLRNVLLLSGK